jgi:2-iminobutanoate/2-iminopropanoate deaminase
MKIINDAPNAPKAIGPYAQGVEHNGVLYLSGQIPLVPESGVLVQGDISKQAEQVLKNITAVLSHEGLTLNAVAKTTIFLTNLGHFQTVNSIYERAFGKHTPARSTVQVAALPRGAEIEIEVIAVR